MKVHTNEFVTGILEKFEKAGYEIYIVGGAVRDVLTGRPVEDWDFTTNATPEKILKVLPKGFYDNIFGTVGISHPSSPNPYEKQPLGANLAIRMPAAPIKSNGEKIWKKTYPDATSP